MFEVILESKYSNAAFVLNVYRGLGLSNSPTWLLISTLHLHFCFGSLNTNEPCVLSLSTVAFKHDNVYFVIIIVSLFTVCLCIGFDSDTGFMYLHINLHMRLLNTHF